MDEFLFLECLMSLKGKSDCRRMLKGMKRLGVSIDVALTAMRDRVKKGDYRHVLGSRSLRNATLGMAQCCPTPPPPVSPISAAREWRRHGYFLDLIKSVERE